MRIQAYLINCLMIRLPADSQCYNGPSPGNPIPAGSGDVFLGILPLIKDLIQTNNYYLLVYHMQP